MRPVSVLAALAGLCASAGCTALWGIGDLSYGPAAGTGGSPSDGGGPSATTSAGGSTASAGSGGSACSPALCPGLDKDCRYRACDGEACGFEDAPLGTKCEDASGGAVCDGAGECVECVEASDCLAPELCSDGYCVPAHCTDAMLDTLETDVDCGGVCAPCDVGQSCNDDEDCASGVCDDGDTCMPCDEGDDDQECAFDHYCDAGTCKPEKQNGDLCQEDEECESHDCADGTCCDDGCAGTCEACVIAKTSSPNGTCALVPQGGDPDGECADQGPASCGAAGEGCSGVLPACQLYPQRTVCSTSAYCAYDAAGASASCDGAGRCLADNATSCQPYACNATATACLTSCATTGDCASGYYCGATNCYAQKSLGSLCVSPDECSSGFCADGLCCDSSCLGICRACDLTDTQGSCTLVPNGQDPDAECVFNCNGMGACE